MKGLRNSSRRPNEIPESPVRKNICAVVVTCNPGGSVFRLLNAIEVQVDSSIIVDNNSPEEIIHEINEYARYRAIRVVRNNRNEGIAKALNQGLSLAESLGYKWVITFDQDTTPFSNIIEIIDKVYQSFPGKSSIGAIGVNFATASKRSYYRVNNARNYALKDYLITSGCLVNISAFRDAGGFREDFFIDNVDLDFSLRLRKKGWINLISKEWGMAHKAGEPVGRRILGIKLTSSGHNPSRRYYMARNHVIMTRDHFFRFPYFISKLNFFYLLSVIRFLLAENDRKSKMASSLKGLRDGFKMKSVLS